MENEFQLFLVVFSLDLSTLWNVFLSIFVISISFSFLFQMSFMGNSSVKCPTLWMAKFFFFSLLLTIFFSQTWINCPFRVSVYLFVCRYMSFSLVYCGFLQKMQINYISVVFVIYIMCYIGSSCKPSWRWLGEYILNQLKILKLHFMLFFVALKMFTSLLPFAV